MLGINDFWTYVLGSAAIVLLPGPNSIFVLTTAARRGTRTGYRAASGVFLGDTVLMVLAAVGVASLLRMYPPLFLVIKYAGAAYLGWVGLGIVRGAIRRWRSPGQLATEMIDEGEAAASRSAEAAPGGSAPQRSPFRRSLFISLLNPKAILFFVSFFVQFVEPGYAYPALSFLVLGAVIQVFSMLYLTILIFSGQFLAGQFRRHRRLAAVTSTGVGALFVGFGVKRATASVG